MTAILRFVNILLAALLAGVSFGIWMGFNPMQLSKTTYLEQQQNMIQSLTVLMVSLVVIAAVVTLISAFVQRQDKTTFFSLILAATCFIACIIITKFGNVPIDNEVMTWTPDTMPENWMDLRNHWWSLHIMRTWTELTALVLVVWSSIRKS